MKKISTYLTYHEGVKSQTAIRLGINNAPNEAQWQAMRHVGETVFDRCREFVGGPLAATSFFRCPALNRAIGGATTSQHLKGEAIDIDADVFGHGTNRALFFFILGHLDFDQLIWEFGNEGHPAWVHVSQRQDGRNRRQALQAYRSTDGKTHYQTFNRDGRTF